MNHACVYIYTYATQSRDNSTVVHVRFQGAWCFGHRCSKAQSAGSSALISGRNPNENMKSDLGYRRREARSAESRAQTSRKNQNNTDTSYLGHSRCKGARPGTQITAQSLSKIITVLLDTAAAQHAVQDLVPKQNKNSVQSSPCTHTHKMDTHLIQWRQTLTKLIQRV